MRLLFYAFFYYLQLIEVYQVLGWCVVFVSFKAYFDDCCVLIQVCTKSTQSHTTVYETSSNLSSPTWRRRFFSPF